MKGAIVISFLLCGVICALATSVQQQMQRPDYGHFDSTFQDVEELSADGAMPHGSRTKRSPLDPIVAPLLIGKSFLYGALLGPKLFHRPRYHYRPYYGHGGGYGYGGGYGGGYGYGGGHGGWGWGRR